MHHFRKLRILAVVALVASMLAQPVAAQDSVTVTVQPGSVAPDGQLVFVGRGFLPEEPTTVTVEDDLGNVQALLAPVRVDAFGEINAVSVPIPSGLALGAHTLRIAGLTSSRSGRAAFQLRWQPPTVQLEMYTAKPTHIFGFVGAGFVPGEQVDVYLGSRTSGALMTVDANGRGDITARDAVVPMVPPGDYNLVFAGRSSATPVSVGFNVQGFRPWAVLDNYYVAPQAGVGIAGVDFVPGEVVDVYLNSELTPPVAQVTADADGRFSAKHAFVLPDVTGTNQVIFVGQRSGSAVTASFAAAPAPSSSSD